MSRKKQYKAIVTDETYMEDLIWMSYRYCIGRKTIAAHSHAGNIARYSFDHISENRRKFMAHDIRREINDALRWRNNINCHDYRNYLEDDAFSIIIYRLLEKYGNELPDGVWDDVKFDIDNGKLTIDKYEGEKDLESLPSLFHDLIVWIKLANALDSNCHRIITTIYEGQKKEHECFRYPQMDWNGKIIHERWVDIESYKKNPSIDTYIDPQYITEISVKE